MPAAQERRGDLLRHQLKEPSLLNTCPGTPETADVIDTLRKMQLTRDRLIVKTTDSPQVIDLALHASRRGFCDDEQNRFP